MSNMLIIDNFDSFTYNLVQGFRSQGAEVNVFRNNAIDVAEAQALQPSHLVISPGPGRPTDAGISMDLIREFASEIPILGVCLGHQCIVEAFGGEITYAKQLMHGKISAINHDQKTIFSNLELNSSSVVGGAPVIFHWVIPNDSSAFSIVGMLFFAIFSPNLQFQKLPLCLYLLHYNFPHRCWYNSHYDLYR